MVFIKSREKSNRDGCNFHKADVVNGNKIIFFYKIAVVMLNNITWISTVLIFVKHKELTCVAIFFKEQAIAFAIRISRKIINSNTKFFEVTFLNFKPAVASVIMFNKGSVHM